MQLFSASRGNRNSVARNYSNFQWNKIEALKLSDQQINKKNKNWIASSKNYSEKAFSCLIIQEF